jgi:hypothetical protein
LRMLVGPVPWIICEWHADFVCAGDGGTQPHCLVSVKHRSPDQGAWPIADLPKRGGLKVLYERWVASERWHACRWVTNGGLKTGSSQTRELAALLAAHPSTGREQRLMSFAEGLTDAIEAEPTDIASFLDALHMTSTGGDEFSMRAQVIETIARPVMQQLGVSPGLARTAYQAVHSLVAEAVLNLNPDEPDLPWMNGHNDADSDRLKRTITRERILDHLRERGIGIPPDAGIAGAQMVSTMIRKLKAGRLGPTVLASAPRFRRRWYELESLYKSDVPNPLQDELSRIRAEVLHRATIAEDRTRRPGEAYGAEMHHQLASLISLDGLNPLLPTSVPDLVGCVYQLTDECDIWWSDTFDPRYEAPWMSVEPDDEPLETIEISA